MQGLRNAAFVFCYALKKLLTVPRRTLLQQPILSIPQASVLFLNELFLPVMQAMRYVHGCMQIFSFKNIWKFDYCDKKFSLAF